MPVMLFGLALALDVFGAASGLGAAGSGSRSAQASRSRWPLRQPSALHSCSRSTKPATSTAACAPPRRWRSWPCSRSPDRRSGGLHLPNAMAGWVGLVALTFLYGTAFTIMFTVLPRLAWSATRRS